MNVNLLKFILSIFFKHIVVILQFRVLGALIIVLANRKTFLAAVGLQDIIARHNITLILRDTGVVYLRQLKRRFRLIPIQATATILTSQMGFISLLYRFAIGINYLIVL